MPKLIISQSFDVYFNLALEDYLLQYSGEDFLFLWQSDNAVVCGKHQNVCGEINYGFCRQNNIKVARRLSGGGTVFHDMGNLNFSFIENLKHGLSKAIDYKQFLDPLREAMLQLNIQTTYSQRNDLLLNGKKISGNAQHIDQRRKRVLHHGTLLIDSDLKSLGQALKSQGNYESHSVKSVRSEVANIVFNEAGKQENVKKIREAIAGYFIDTMGYENTTITELQKQQIEEIKNNKYRRFDWIVGYSPVYIANKEIMLQNQKVALNYKVEQLKISEIKLYNHHINGAEALAEFEGQELSEELSFKFDEKFQFHNPYILF